MGANSKFNKSKSNNIPTARHDPKTKRITVTCYFGPFKQIKAKLIKERDEWMKLWEELDFTNVQFNEIESFFSARTTQNVKEALRQYVKDYPDHFSADIFNCTYLAIFENPDFRPSKTRKPSPYGDSVKAEITELAPRLYIYLQKMGKKPEKSWPSFFTRFLETYEIQKHNPKPLDKWNHHDLKDIVRFVISKYIGMPLSERFWQTFLTDRRISLKLIKKFSHRINPTQDRILSDLFEEFII